MSKTPQFPNEKEEAEFWDTHSATEFLDDTEPVEVVFVDARPRKVQISLRLDPQMVTQLKNVAKTKGIGYQTLIRLWVAERLGQEQVS